MSLCWSCGEQFILTAASMKNDRPECLKCMYGVEEEEEVSFCIVCRNQFVGSDMICPDCKTKKLTQAAQNPKPRALTTPLVEPDSSITEEDKPESEYIPPVDEVADKPLRVEPPSPKRTPAQQKLYDEQVRAFRESIERDRAKSGRNEPEK